MVASSNVWAQAWQPRIFSRPKIDTLKKVVFSGKSLMREQRPPSHWRNFSLYFFGRREWRCNGMILLRLSETGRTRAAGKEATVMP